MTEPNGEGQQKSPRIQELEQRLTDLRDEVREKDNGEIFALILVDDYLCGTSYMGAQSLADAFLNLMQSDAAFARAVTAAVEAIESTENATQTTQ